MLVAIQSGQALAQTNDEAPDQTDRSVYSVAIENDLFADTDRHYTNGLRLSRLSKVEDATTLHRLGTHFFSQRDASPDVWFEMGLGHSIYTPEDIGRVIPDPEDRPYAGYLHVDLGLVAKQGNRLDQAVLSVGVVGPAAFGEKIQNGFHDLIDKERALGWEAQIPNEPIINIQYRRSQRLYTRQFGYMDFDVTPHIGGALGNANTHVGTGAMVRFGSDLPDDFGPPRIGSTLPGSGFFKPRDNIGWYLFAAAEGRAVAHDIFLDGALFSDSPNVDKRDFAGDIQTGLVVNIENVRVGYTHIFRSKEFEGQTEADQFGAFSISFRY